MKPGRKSVDNPCHIAFQKLVRSAGQDAKMDEFVASGVFRAGWNAAQQHYSAMQRQKRIVALRKCNKM